MGFLFFLGCSLWLLCTVSATDVVDVDESALSAGTPAKLRRQRKLQRAAAATTMQHSSSNQLQASSAHTRLQLKPRPTATRVRHSAHTA